MRIAMIGSRGIPARVGGVERVIEELTRELASRGHEVIVYARPYYVAGASAPPAGRTIVTPGLRGKHLDTITHTATAMFDVLRRGVDVVHIHSPGPALMSWLARACDKPIVLTIHAADWKRRKWSAPARVMLKAGLDCGMRLAGAVTAVSEPLAAELSRAYDREVIYVPNAVRPVQPRPLKAIRRWGLRDEQYALYVGRIVPEKRLDLLLRAWATMGRSQPLVVVGDAGQNSYGRRCRRRAGRNVLFTGPQYGEVLAELYSHAALVVLPSDLEGMSLVLLEAAAYGRCILGADIPANIATMGDSILYFSSGDIGELCGQIGRSLNAEALRRDFGRRARAHVGSKYSWPASAEQMESIYRRTGSARRG